MRAKKSQEGWVDTVGDVVVVLVRTDGQILKLINRQSLAVGGGRAM